MTSKDPFILFIEDERPMLELVRQSVKMAGYTVTGATSGREGLDLMKQKKPDLLLLDLMMPGINGWDVYRSMKADASLADVPVIVITAKIPPADLVIVQGLPPAEDYITKPFDIASLIRAIEKLL
jgi:two-component system, OmpR family, alkaline phosphatase synthesis response regulator PhoP